MPSTHELPPAGRIGDYLRLSPSDVEWAASVQAAELASGNEKRFGQILLEREEITEDQLRAALNAQCIDRLRRCHFFADLTDDELAEISAVTEEVRLAEDEDLFKEDQRGDSVYVVASGRMVMYHRCDDSYWTPLGTAQPGSVLGEMGYFSNGTRSYSACALEPTVLLRIRYDLLSRFIDSMPRLAVGMLNLVTNRIREGELRRGDEVPA